MMHLRAGVSRRVLGAVIAAGLVAAVMVAVLPSSPAGAGDVVPEGSVYVPVAPYRTFDTRPDKGRFGFTPSEGTDKIAHNGQIDVPITGAHESGPFIPADAVAVMVNVAYTGGGTDASGWITAFPAGGTKPNASNINKSKVDTVANLVAVRIGDGGKISIANSGTPVHLLGDIAGYFIPGAGAPGPQGEQGEQGVQGEQGEQGEPGAPGEDGVDGSSCSVSKDGEAMEVTVACEDGTSVCYSTTTGETCSAKPARLYSENFTQADAYAPGTPQHDNWAALVADLAATPSGYTSVTMSGSFDPIGITCADPVQVDAFASAMGTRTSTIVACDGHNWETFEYGDTVWIAVDVHPSLCPSPGYVMRPILSFPNWGGVNSPTCLAPSQTMTLAFFD